MENNEQYYFKRIFASWTYINTNLQTDGAKYSRMDQVKSVEESL